MLSHAAPVASLARPVARLVAASALVAVIGCSDPAAPAGGPAVALLAPSAEAPRPQLAVEGGSRAWHIRASVSVTPATPPDGCLAYFTSVIQGHATHLGRFEGVGTTCVTAQVAPDPDPPFRPAGPPPYATATFHNPGWTLTAANGDELWLEGLESTAVLSAIDMSLIAEGRMRVVGGTGRFEGATGTASVGATNDDGVGPDDFYGNGWIRY